MNGNAPAASQLEPEQEPSRTCRPAGSPQCRAGVTAEPAPQPGFT